MNKFARLPAPRANCFQICHTCRQSLVHRLSKPRSALNRAKLSKPEQQSASPRRDLHITRTLHENTPRENQAQPLGDFYTDLLAAPIPKAAKAESSLPTFVRSGDETKEERAQKLFGDIKGSGYEKKVYEIPDATWRTINGVPVPPRPSEPDNCCMSGCVHCVWDDYRDDIEEWAARVYKAQARGDQSTAQSPNAHMARSELGDASTSMDDDGGGSEALWSSPSPTSGESEDLFSGIPVGIREFMATEKKIRDRKKARTQEKRPER